MSLVLRRLTTLISSNQSRFWMHPILAGFRDFLRCLRTIVLDLRVREGRQ